ncbi:MAG: ABC transporter ATP-binding protein [Candidatus Rokubacteria bacterium]|nr:ABC transporter ATP-binding protein [Candidatus Rokubacteria bacterium]MBI3104803.1 ABC transporter ATP-binding protein [Candidatus Rokubacteria bacterium]
MASGECMALLGPSGCGKTTTLNLIAGFLDPDAGSILIDGTSVERVPAHQRNIGMVFQNYALFPHMSVAANVAFGLEMRGVARGETRSRVAEALELVHLTGMEKRYPKQLSGGQQQRVALARALVIRPSVLLFDEPLSNLDAGLRQEMRFEIRAIQKAVGITTIFVTHDQEEALVIADRLAVVNFGKVEQVGTPSEVYGSPRTVFVARFLGQANLFRGTVRRRDEGGGVVETASGLRLAVGRPSGSETGDQVTVVVRPESIDVTSEPTPAQNCFPATVRQVTYLGATIQLSLAFGDMTVQVWSKAEGAIQPTPGERVFVNWPAERALVVEDGTR